MSNTNPGNPHYDAALKHEDAMAELIQATLALAHEQRTANMIAVFGQIVNEDGETFLGERINGYELAKDIKERITKVNPGLGEIAIPAPTLPTKAVGSKDSHYLRTAARNIQSGYNVGGSGVTNMIITLLTNTADAMEAEGK